jgi:hypothetical protein
MSASRHRPPGTRASELGFRARRAPVPASPRPGEHGFHVSRALGMEALCPPRSSRAGFSSSLARPSSVLPHLSRRPSRSRCRCARGRGPGLGELGSSCGGPPGDLELAAGFVEEAQRHHARPDGRHPAGAAPWPPAPVGSGRSAPARRCARAGCRGRQAVGLVDGGFLCSSTRPRRWVSVGLGYARRLARLPEEPRC